MGNVAQRKLFWIVVADKSKAIIYTCETRRGALLEAETFDNQAATQKTEQLISDRGGRSFDSHGHGRHTIAKENTDPKSQLAIAFARRVADRIVKAKRGGECREFTLIAAPRFLGYLRDALSATPDVVATDCFDKSLVGEPVNVIEALLRGR